MPELNINAKFTPGNAAETDEDGNETKPATEGKLTLTCSGTAIFEFPLHAIPADIACAVADQIYARVHTAVLPAALNP